MANRIKRRVRQQAVEAKPARKSRRAKSEPSPMGVNGWLPVQTQAENVPLGTIVLDEIAKLPLSSLPVLQPSPPPIVPPLRPTPMMDFYRRQADEEMYRRTYFGKYETDTLPQVASVPQTPPEPCRSPTQKVRDLVKDIDLSGFPFPLKISVEDWCDCLCATMTVRDRSYMGAPLERVPGWARDKSITGHEPTYNLIGATDKDTLNNIRQYLLDLITHEFHEAFLVRGERVFDPHDSSKRPKNSRF